MLPGALPNAIIGHRNEHSSEQEHQLFEDKSTAPRLATAEGIALCSLNAIETSFGALPVLLSPETHTPL